MKKLIFIVIFSLFAYYLTFSSHGIIEYIKLKGKNSAIDEEIKRIERENHLFEEKIKSLQEMKR